MSQEKVDYYKEQKKNRKSIMRKEKIQTRLIATVTVVVLAALIGWFSWAVYGNAKATAEANAEATTTTLDVTAMEAYQTTLSDYASNLEAEEEAADADTEAEDTETVVSSSQE